MQLRNQGLSGRSIASAQGIARNSVQAVLDAADRLGVVWDDVAEQSEAEVYAAVFPGRGVHESVFAQPDWPRVHTELARVGVTLKLLHQEYVDAASMAQATMSYDRFCRLYGEHAAVSGATSRVGHKAGRSIEVDWSGPTMQLLDPTTGELSRVYLFVACLPFSRYAFVEASLDMKQEPWLRAHTAMFAFFGGSVPRLVPDNLKTGVISHPKEGEVVLNDAYREMAGRTTRQRSSRAEFATLETRVVPRTRSPMSRPGSSPASGTSSLRRWRSYACGSGNRSMPITVSRSRNVTGHASVCSPRRRSRCCRRCRRPLSRSARGSINAR